MSTLVRNYGPSVVPPGGKLVFDKEGERVEGLTPNELIDKLTQLRSANHKRIGDPGRDIHRFLRGVSGYSSPISIARVEKKPPMKLRLIDRVNSWLMTRYAKLSTLRYINPTDAQHRANICKSCPKNKEWKSSCASCSAESKREIERNVVIISQNKRTMFHDRLKACAVAGHENRVAVFLEAEFLKHRIRFMDELPEKCWMKKL